MRLKKFKQRVFAAFVSLVCSISLASYDFILPQKADAAPLGIAAVIADVLAFGTAAEVAAIAAPIVVGSIAAGAVYYSYDGYGGVLGTQLKQYLSGQAYSSYCGVAAPPSGCIFPDDSNLPLSSRGGPDIVSLQNNGSLLSDHTFNDLGSSDCSPGHPQDWGVNINQEYVGRARFSTPNNVYCYGYGILGINNAPAQLARLPDADKRAAIATQNDDKVSAAIASNTFQTGSISAKQVLPNGIMGINPHNNQFTKLSGPITLNPDGTVPDSLWPQTEKPIPDPSPSPTISPTSDPSSSPSPTISPTSDPSSSPSPTISPTSDPSSSPSPTTSPTSDPLALKPATFNKPNFFAYALQVFSKKFPFDIFGSIPTAQIPTVCPSFTFFSQTQELCIVKDFISGLKWPAVIAFLIWGVMSI